MQVNRLLHGKRLHVLQFSSLVANTGSQIIQSTWNPVISMHCLLWLYIKKGNDNKCHPRLGNLLESQNKIHIIGGWHQVHASITSQTRKLWCFFASGKPRLLWQLESSIPVRLQLVLLLWSAEKHRQWVRSFEIFHPRAGNPWCWEQETWCFCARGKAPLLS